jgi:hypothetical protein
LREAITGQFLIHAKTDPDLKSRAESGNIPHATSPKSSVTEHFFIESGSSLLLNTDPIRIRNKIFLTKCVKNIHNWKFFSSNRHIGILKTKDVQTRNTATTFWIRPDPPTRIHITTPYEINVSPPFPPTTGYQMVVCVLLSVDLLKQANFKFIRSNILQQARPLPSRPCAQLYLLHNSNRPAYTTPKSVAKIGMYLELNRNNYSGYTNKGRNVA